MQRRALTGRLVGFVAVGALAAGLAPGAAQAKGIPASGVIDLASDADAALTGGTAGSRAGFAVAQVGDVNGDGHADVAVLAPGASPSGRDGAGTVHVIFGPVTGDVDLTTAPGLRIAGAAAGDGLGTAVAPAGDVNGDGLADVLVGAPGAGEAAGAAYVVAGRRDAGSVDLAAADAALLTIAGGQTGDRLAI
jgi:hypothetical protein